MALSKQTVNLNFAQGLDTKTDRFQVPPGLFLELENAVFTKAGLLQKRNGFGALTSLPDTTSTFLTTFNGNLTAIGSTLSAYSQGASTWVSKGHLQPIQLDTLPLIRSNTNQIQCDTAVASNGLICTVFTDNVPVSGSIVAQYKYAIADGTTGQNIVAPTQIAVTTGAVAGSPRVFAVKNYFVIVFTNNISGTYHLQYIAISTVNPTSVTVNTDISSQYTPASTVAFDGVVTNDTLYLAWNGSDGGGAIRVTYIDSTLTQHSTVVFATRVATQVSVCADTTTPTPTIWVTISDTASQKGYSIALSSILVTVLAPTQWANATVTANIATSVTGGVLNIFYEILRTYSYDGSVPTHQTAAVQITQAGVVSAGNSVMRGVGIASKAFTVGTTIYVLVAYQSPNQSTYFLIDSSGNMVAKLAYSNGAGYPTLGLPSATVSGTTVYLPYLIKDLVQSVNKTQGAAASSGIYAQTGINLCTFNFAPSITSVAETGANINLSGGFLWAYDGYQAVEQGFALWPDSVEVAVSHSGGAMTVQDYFYAVTYEWADNQGNIFRSAPSIPVQAASASFSGSSNSVTVYIPTLRATYKTANPVKIVIYRWSTAQQTYYQVTSVANPTMNDTTVDSIVFTDILADSSIIGNNILYTTGGVIENIGPPAAAALTLWQSRLFLIDAEDKNLLWFSKVVIEGTPVEMSDLLTIYVAPTIGSQGSTGPMRCISPMDDKLIIFKDNAAYYITGQGPDNTGANNQYSDPVFITSTVGCANQNSIVFIPSGLMFQSDKGIWLLGRDLSTQYIGAAVEDFTTGATILSAINVPGTNQVRFTLDTGITLMYDYYFKQWGTFVNVPAISSTLYQGLHTYVNSAGKVFQETPNLYLDGSRPVLLHFLTSWYHLAGLQGFQRAYYFFLLGTYISPHFLTLSIAYDYNPAPTQTTVITPDNYNATYGESSGLYGNESPYGGNDVSEQWQVFLQRQKCEAFQISMQESYDPSFGVPAGAGLTMSGLSLTVGVKKGDYTLRASRNVG